MGVEEGLPAVATDAAPLKPVAPHASLDDNPVVATPETVPHAEDDQDIDSPPINPAGPVPAPQKRSPHARRQHLKTFTTVEMGDSTGGGGPVTGIVRMEVLNGRQEQFLAFLDRIGEVLRGTPGFLGRDVIEPQKGSSTYVIILRFKDIWALENWKNSDIRQSLLGEGEQSGVLRVVALDVEEGNSTLTVIDPSKYDHQQQQAAAAAPPRTEPAKWKVTMVIYLAAISVSLPVNLLLRPQLLHAGLTPPESFFTCASLIAVGIVFVTSPLLSLLFKPFLRPWPTKIFDTLTQREPFRTLELGLPCLRPEPPAYLALMQGLRADISSLEALINEIEHKSHLQRWRLQERVDRLEESFAALVEAVEPDVADPVGLFPVRTTSLSVEGRPVEQPLPTAAGGGDGDSSDPAHLALAIPQPAGLGGGIVSSAAEEDKVWAVVEGERGRVGGQDPVTVVIHERVKPAAMSEFVEHVYKLATVAKRFRGFMGCSLIKPSGKASKGEATVILKFATYEQLHDFLASEQRRRWLVRMRQLVEEEGSVELQAGRRDVVDHIFAHPAPALSASGTGGQAVQKWKMAVLIFVALGSLGYPLSTLYFFPTYLPSLGYVNTLLFFTSVSVSITIYVTIPLLLLLLRRWVFAPWTPSAHLAGRILQSGFPCLS